MKPEREAKPAPVSASVETISEEELERLCDEIYSDRFEIYGFRPVASRREAVLWMLLGCLISLLNVSDEELQALAGSSTSESYGEIICKLTKERSAQPFDPQPVLERLTTKIEDE